MHIVITFDSLSDAVLSSQTHTLLYVTAPAGVWSVHPTTGEKPPPLADHTFTKIDHHRAVVFGGWTGSCKLNDTYVLDMETWVRMCIVHTVWIKNSHFS